MVYWRYVKESPAPGIPDVHIKGTTSQHVPWVTHTFKHQDHVRTSASSAQRFSRIALLHSLLFARIGFCQARSLLSAV